MKMDLHLHSIYSDGTYDLPTIVSLAKDLDLIALTDHNTFHGNQEFAKLVHENQLSALAGCELTVSDGNTEIHLLCYYPIDTNFTLPAYNQVNRINTSYKENKILTIKETIQLLQQDYPQCSYDAFIELMKSKGKTENFNRVHIAMYLQYLGLTNSIQDGFDRFIGDTCKYYVHKKQIDIIEAMKCVFASGGFASIAHLVQYDYTNEQIEALLMKIAKVCPTFGIELFHYDHSLEDIQNYLEITQRVMEKTNCKIYYTAGSDCHGAHKPNRIGFPYAFKLDQPTSHLLQSITDEFIIYIKTQMKVGN